MTGKPDNPRAPGVGVGDGWKGRVGSILLFVIASASPTLALLGILPLHAAWAATPIRRPQGEVNVLLGIQADDEGWDVHHLLSDPGRGMAAEGTGNRTPVGGNTTARCLDPDLVTRVFLTL